MSAPSVCPVRGVCLSPGPCANAAGGILQIKPGPEALALFGFSQGAMMSLHIAPRRAAPVAAPQRLPTAAAPRASMQGVMP